jgi:hypothetical protein
VRSSDLYPLILLTGYKLMSTGSGEGVMAICDRHDGEVSALVVNSLTEPPMLADLAFMAGEHEAEHHGGPAMSDPDGAPRCQEPTCPDYGDPDFGEATCPAEHADPSGGAR